MFIISKVVESISTKKLILINLIDDMYMSKVCFIHCLLYLSYYLDFLKGIINFLEISMISLFQLILLTCVNILNDNSYILYSYSKHYILVLKI